MAVTNRDVAVAAGVSTATVSHVFNGTRFVAEATKQRVLEAAKQLRYVPNVSASSLRSNKSKRIGLLVPSISSYFSVDILDAVEQVMKENGYQVVLGCSHDDLQREKQQVDSFNFQQVDGMLMFPAPGDHSYLNQMQRKYPIVFIDRGAESCERDMIVGNNEQATYELVCQMIREGHRKIGIINGKEKLSSLKERIAGYKRALEENGIPFEPQFIQEEECTIEGAYQATERLLEGGRVTIILPLSPILTIGCMRCLVKHGIEIPREIALVGYGDSEWAEVTNPPLTTMLHPLFEMGQMAARKLLQRLEESERLEHGEGEKTIAPYEIVRLPIRLIRRKSF